jgi:hypothetical protein
MDGGSLSGLLTIVFVVLKLTGVISWSWWWVFSPLLISAGLAVLAVLVVVLAAVIFHKKFNMPGPVGRKLSRR